MICRHCKYPIVEVDFYRSKMTYEHLESKEDGHRWVSCAANDSCYDGDLTDVAEPDKEYIVQQLLKEVDSQPDK